MRARGCIAGLIVAAAAAGVAWLAWPGGARPNALGIATDAAPHTVAQALRGAEASARERHEARLPDAAAPPASQAGSEPPREPGMRYLRVVDGTTGLPVPLVRVHSFELNGLDALDWEDFTPTRWATNATGQQTDAWGRVRIEIGLDDGDNIHWLASATGGRFSLAIVTPAGQGDFTLTLVPGNVITGVARDTASGKPLVDADVMLAMGNSGGSAFGAGRATRTDAQGRYQFAGLPAGIPFIPMLRNEQQFAGPDVSDEWELWGWDASEQQHEDEEPLAAMLARGRAKTFTRLGQSHSIDLSAGVRPGIRVTYVLRLPSEATHCGRVLFELQQDGVDPGDWQGGWLHPEEGIATREAFLGIGTFHVRCHGNGVYLAAEPKVVTGTGARETIELALDATPPLLVQFVDELGTPIAKAGIALSHGLLRRSINPTASSGPAQMHVTVVSRGRSDAHGRLPLDLPLLPWEDMSTAAADLFLAASGEGLFQVEVDRIGPAHIRIDAVDLRRRLRGPGTDPVVLKVPARAWAPLRVRVVSPSQQPLSGITVQGHPARAYHERTTGVTDSAGYATLRVLKARATFASSIPRRPGEAEPELDERELLSVKTTGLLGRLSTPLGLALLSSGHRLPAGVRENAAPDGASPEFMEAGVITIVAVPARVVALHLTLADGSPVTDGYAWLSYRGEARYTAYWLSPDAEGNAEVRLPRSTDSLELTVTRPNLREVKLRLAPGATSVTVKFRAKR